MDAHGVTTWQPEQQEFLRIFIHDALGPLVSIRGLANLLERSESPERNEEARRLIVGQVEGLRSLVSRLRVVLDEGDVDVQVPIPLDSSELAFIAKVAINTASECDSEVIQRIHCTFDLEQPILIPDLMRFRRILTNLLTNAVRHTQGPIELYVRGSHRLLIEVCDRGTDFQPRRGGLGIRIIKDLVSSLGGEVTWNDRPGGGLIARVVLPISTD